jgi:hypothetical protein
MALAEKGDSDRRNASKCQSHSMTWCMKDAASVAYPGILFGGGSTNSVEDREKGDLGAVTP